MAWGTGETSGALKTWETSATLLPSHAWISWGSNANSWRAFLSFGTRQASWPRHTGYARSWSSMSPFGSWKPV